MTLAVVGAIVGEWAGADRGLGVLVNLARGSLFDIPLMFATLLTIALLGIVLYVLVVARRAPPRRRPLSPAHGGRMPRSASLIAVAARRRSSSPRASARLVAVARRLRRRVGRRSADRPPAPPTPLTVGLGYIPSVQFAPFYLADQAGYYARRGPRVTFQNEIDAEPRPELVGQGALDIGVADGTSVIPAVSQGIPIRTSRRSTAQFPSIVFAQGVVGDHDARPTSKGKKIGIPGKYGSSWIMLQALLDSAGLTPDDVDDRRVPRLRPGRRGRSQGAVDAATGFANNEPVQLELTGDEGGRAPRRRRHAAARARA